MTTMLLALVGFLAIVAACCLLAVGLAKLLGPAPHRPPVHPLLRAAVLARDGHRCLRCRSTHNLQMDHVRPYVDGGPTTYANLQTLCRTCNLDKGTDTVDYRARMPNVQATPRRSQRRQSHPRAWL